MSEKDIIFINNQIDIMDKSIREIDRTGKSYVKDYRNAISYLDETKVIFNQLSDYLVERFNDMLNSTTLDLPSIRVIGLLNKHNTVIVANASRDVVLFRINLQNSTITIPHKKLKEKELLEQERLDFFTQALEDNISDKRRIEDIMFERIANSYNKVDDSFKAKIIRFYNEKIKRVSPPISDDEYGRRIRELNVKIHDRTKEVEQLNASIDLIMLMKDSRFIAKYMDYLSRYMQTKFYIEEFDD